MDQRYEYDTLFFKRVTMDSLAESLNERAEDGWQAISPITVSESLVGYVLERPVE